MDDLEEKRMVKKPTLNDVAQAILELKELRKHNNKKKEKKGTQ